MRALLSRRPGGPETLELDEIPEPVAGSGQVRVAVRKPGRHAGDWPALILGGGDRAV